MNRKVLAALCIIMVFLVGCGEKDQPVNTPLVEPIESEAPSEPAVEEETPDPESEEAPEEQPEAPATTITERVVVDGKMQSYLTGEWKDEAVAKRRSMAVMIPNNQPALPQYGISRASIIYEAPVEGRMTRLMVFIEDYDDLDHVGPVRSSRDYYVYEAMAYDAIYCNWGLAVPFVEDLLAGDRIDNVSQAVSGIHNPASEAFTNLSRGKNYKGNSYAKEFTGYLTIDGYEKAVERLGYEREYRDRFVQAFTFAADGYPAKYEDHESATLIYPGGTTSNSSGFGYGGGSGNPYFEYHEDEGLYYRYQFGGPQIDEMNGEQVKVSNIVFKICHGEVHEPTDKDYLAFGVHGEGDAYVFTAGKVIKGTWTRTADPEVNMFYDENGNEVIMNQGKTWICCIWKEYADCMSYE